MFIWVFPKIMVPPNHPIWMVKIMEKPMNKWDDLGVFPLFLETPIYIILVENEKKTKKKEHNYR